MNDIAADLSEFEARISALIVEWEFTHPDHRVAWVTVCRDDNGFPRAEARAEVRRNINSKGGQ